MRSFHFHDVFMVVLIRHHQRCIATGVLQFQADAVTGYPTNNTHVNPISFMEEHMQEIGSPLDVWHNLDKIKRLKSCRVHCQPAEDVDHQNLEWSCKLLMKNIDPTL